MNVVLADTEEFRKLKMRRKLADGKHQTEEREIKRSVGLMMIRGENILTLTAEAPPPAKPKPAANAMAAAGAGRGVPVGRGVPIAAMTGPVVGAPVGLAGAAVRGVGPSPQMMGVGASPAPIGAPRVAPGVVPVPLMRPAMGLPPQ